MVEGKAAPSEFVGNLKLVHATDQLDKVADKLRFLEQDSERRPKIGGPSRSLSTSRVSQQGTSPTFSADGEVAGILAQPPVWPPPGAKASVEWSKLTGTSSPFQFGHPPPGRDRSSEGCHRHGAFQTART